MVKLREEPGSCQALALYAAVTPPSAAEVKRRFGRSGVRIRSLPPGPRGAWGFEIDHPEWGEACIAGIAEPPELSPLAIQISNRLVDEEKGQAQAARSVLAVITSEREGHAPEDRKYLLRFLEVLLDPSTPHATGFDCRASKLWSATALREELEHDADLDLHGLIEMHGVSQHPAKLEMRADGRSVVPPRIDWFHTHGLAELGSYDFEILRPSPILLLDGFEILRGLAHRLLYGTLEPGAPRQTLFVPDGDIALIEVARFDAEGPRDERALRVRLPDGDLHDGPRRVVVCDPLVASDPQAQRTKRWPVRASRALRRLPSASSVIDFPPQATALLAERAQKTVPALRAIVEEFSAELLEPIVQVFCPLGNPAANAPWEILWFELEGFENDETFTGKLRYPPQRPSDHVLGQRMSFGIEDLANWRIWSPVGPITPYDRIPVRALRKFLPQLRAELAAERARMC
ncbi:MAG: hypothetical protein IPN34_16370 [Planctomycetes bacterium]|nr:hypothetical protein [Planctomycetota bacterium]